MFNDIFGNSLNAIQQSPLGGLGSQAAQAQYNAYNNAIYQQGMSVNYEYKEPPRFTKIHDLCWLITMHNFNWINFFNELQDNQIKTKLKEFNGNLYITFKSDEAEAEFIAKFTE